MSTARRGTLTCQVFAIQRRQHRVTRFHSLALSSTNNQDILLPFVVGPLYVIMEYAARGNLRNFLREHRPTEVSTESINEWFNVASTCTNGTALTFGDLMSFAAQVANGLLYLSTNMVNCMIYLLIFIVCQCH